jgi:hypothetical protein
LVDGRAARSATGPEIDERLRAAILAEAEGLADSSDVRKMQFRSRVASRLARESGEPLVLPSSCPTFNRIVDEVLAATGLFRLPAKSRRSAQNAPSEGLGLFELTDFSPRLARRFCSVLLARLLAPLGWHAAVRYLDLPESFINYGYNTAFVTLRRHGQFEELLARIKQLAIRSRPRTSANSRLRQREPHTRPDDPNQTGAGSNYQHLRQPRHFRYYAWFSKARMIVCGYG